MKKINKTNKIKKWAALDLFSGIGGFSLALQRNCRTIAYCDKSIYAQNVLKSLMERSLIDKAPLITDVKDIDTKLFQSYKIKKIDIITAGFPCQDISVMNHKGKGIHGDRSSLVFEVIRIAKLMDVDIVILENSPNIVHKGIELVLNQFEALGYSFAYDFFSASQVGAPHIRKRFYFIAYKPRKSSLFLLSDLKDCYQEDVTLERFWDTVKNNDKKGNGTNKEKKEEEKEKEKGKEKRKKERIPRIMENNEKNYDNLSYRSFLLGNSIVPQCARYAISFLALQLLEGKKGFIDSKTFTKKKAFPFVMRIPKEYYISNPEFKQTDIFKKNIYSTPLASAFNITKVGSWRALRILQNQIMFDPETFKNIKIDRKKNVDQNVNPIISFKSWLINPIFLEWLMGYSQNWTLV